MKRVTLLLGMFGLLSHASAQQPTEIWGMTREGGYGFGTIFKTDNNGNNPIAVPSFKGKHAVKNPSTRFCEAGNGKLYATMDGGIYDNGAIVEYDPANGEFTKKIDFNYLTVGAHPSGMVLASNGLFYGTTSTLHDFDSNPFRTKEEIIFEYNPISNVLIKKNIFALEDQGIHPSGEMIPAGNGKLYGVTESGGANQDGVLFEYDPATNVLLGKISFNKGIDGGYPVSQLAQATNGKIYGITKRGGVNQVGATIYGYDIVSNQLNILYRMDRSSESGLTLGNDGLFYGTTDQNGTLFRFNPVNALYTTVVTFDSLLTGVSPFGNLEKGSNGLLYGTTKYGGLKNDGTLFEFNPATSTLKKVFDFDNSISGANPVAALEQASNGKLYGSTCYGGKRSLGTVFQYDINALVYKKLADLGDATDGKHPNGTLSLAANGKIYAVAPEGGEYGNGILLECDPTFNTGTVTKKIEFYSSINGKSPYFAPVQGPNGKLYGTTSEGGASDRGTVYEYDPVANLLTTKIHFAFDNNIGYNPSGLVLAGNQKLYGINTGGGAHSNGVLFEFDPATGVYKKLKDIQGAPSEGYFPSGPMMQAKNGKLFGVLSRKLTNSPGGLLFEYDIANDSLFRSFYFTGSNGEDPVGTLAEAPNGKLYGVTFSGGVHNKGTLYEYDPVVHLHKKLIDFSVKDSLYNPCGPLLMASNGKLYGSIASGINNRGVFIEYDYLTGNLTKKFNFDGKNGMFPAHNNLIEVCKSIPYTGIAVQTWACENTAYDIPSGFPKTGYTFQWYKHGVLLPGETAEKIHFNSLQITDGSDYHCIVNNGCRAIQTAKTELTVYPYNLPVCKGTSIEEQEAIVGLSLYPNPASDEFQLLIHRADAKQATVEVIDVLGKSVLQKAVTLSDHPTTVSIEHLENGIYWIRIKDHASMIFENRKLVKQ